MAIFKPESNGSYTSFLGYCEFGILEFRDKSKDFDWADIYIEMRVKQKGSDYDRPLQIKGSLEKEGNAGTVSGGAVLKRMYHFFEQIGCSAGINVKGEWEDENGKKIKNIASYLSDKFLSAVIPGTNPSYNYLGYFYKETPKVPDGKVYTRVFTKVYQNKEGNKAKLSSDVQWMKSKGYLKEMADEVQVNTDISGSGLANL